MLARLSSRVQLLAASTVEVARIEALRELKSSSQRVGPHHVEKTGAVLKAPNGTVLTLPLMQYVQTLAKKATLDELKSTYPSHCSLGQAQAHG